MKVLAIDIGGSNVKVLATGEENKRKIPSGEDMTPEKMIKAVLKQTADWDYEAISIAYPGAILGGEIVKEPHNLGEGWVGFDFEKAFGKPVRLLNDAAMQALGSYNDGTMLFLGLGTGLGACLIKEGTIVPLEIAHLPYRKDRTYEEYWGKEGHKRLGDKKWEKHVHAIVAHFRAAFVVSDVVLGGGEVDELDELPEGCRQGSNANAFLGGFRLWK